MSEVLGSSSGEQYHIDRANDLGLPVGTGKRYSEEDLDRLVKESAGGAHHFAKVMVGGYYVSKMREFSNAGIDLNDPHAHFSANAAILFGLTQMAYNPSLEGFLGYGPGPERFDFLLDLLGEYTAEATVPPIACTKKMSKKQQRHRSQKVTMLAEEHTNLYRDIARLTGLNDPIRVAEIHQEITGTNQNSSPAV